MIEVIRQKATPCGLYESYVVLFLDPKIGFLSQLLACAGPQMESYNLANGERASVGGLFDIL